MNLIAAAIAIGLGALGAGITSKMAKITARGLRHCFMVA